MTKKTQGIKVDVNVESQSFAVSVRDGKSITRTETFYIADLPDAIKARLQVQGAPTILGQRASDIKGDPDAKLDRMMEVWDFWSDKGEWELPREGGTRQVSPIIEVLAEKTGATIAAVQKSWAKYPEASRDKLLAKYAKEIEAVKLARESSDEVNLDELMD
jgi:hypothetical protein